MTRIYSQTWTTETLTPSNLTSLMLVWRKCVAFSCISFCRSTFWSLLQDWTNSWSIAVWKLWVRSTCSKSIMLQHLTQHSMSTVCSPRTQTVWAPLLSKLPSSSLAKTCPTLYPMSFTMLACKSANYAQTLPRSTAITCLRCKDITTWRTRVCKESCARSKSSSWPDTVKLSSSECISMLRKFKLFKCVSACEHSRSTLASIQIDSTCQWSTRDCLMSHANKTTKSSSTRPISLLRISLILTCQSRQKRISSTTVRLVETSKSSTLTKCESLTSKEFLAQQTSSHVKAIQLKRFVSSNRGYIRSTRNTTRTIKRISRTLMWQLIRQSVKLKKCCPRWRFATLIHHRARESPRTAKSTSKATLS